MSTKSNKSELRQSYGHPQTISPSARNKCHSTNNRRKTFLRLHVSFSEKACSDLKSSFSYLHRHQGKRSDHHYKQSLKQFNKVTIHTCTLVRNFQIKDLNNYMHKPLYQPRCTELCKWSVFKGCKQMFWSKNYHHWQKHKIWNLDSTC